MLLQSQITIGGVRTGCAFLDLDLISVDRHPAKYHRLAGVRFDVSGEFERQGRSWSMTSSMFSWAGEQPGPEQVLQVRQELEALVTRWACRRQRLVRERLAEQVAAERLSLTSLEQQLQRAQAMVSEAVRAVVQCRELDVEIGELEARVQELRLLRARAGEVAASPRTVARVERAVARSGEQLVRLETQLAGLDGPPPLSAAVPGVSLPAVGIGLDLLD